MALVSVRPGEDYHGVCQHPNVLHYDAANLRERRRIARDMIVACYAGVHAQRLVDWDASDQDGASDQEDAFELSRQWQVLPRRCSFVGDDIHFAFLEKLKAEAGRLVWRHLASIEALAAALVERTELDGDEAKVIAGME